MKISIFGTGYVGLVTGTCLAEVGHEVICIDIDQKKIDNLKQGILPIYEPGLEELVLRNHKEGRLHFSTNAKKGIDFGTVVFNCVGTPPDKSNKNKADLTYIKAIAKTFGEYLDTEKILINKSTVPVGTAELCSDIIQKELDGRNKNVWFEVVSNPEFLKEGVAVKDFMLPDRIVCGVASEKSQKLMQGVYEPLLRSYRSIFFTDIKSAEIIKYASNAFLATKISFINEIANFVELVGGNIQDIAHGMGMDNRIGPKFLHAGIGYGGSCFPKDVQALIASGEEVNYDFKIIKATEAVNQEQKLSIVNKLSQHITNLTNKIVAIRGLAFKPKTDDIREAPSLNVIKHLLDQGVNKLQLFDPVAMENFKQLYPESETIQYASNPYTAAKDADVLLILTERDAFRGADLQDLANTMRGNLVLDGRNIRESSTLAEHGMIYEGVGK